MEEFRPAKRKHEDETEMPDNSGVYRAKEDASLQKKPTLQQIIDRVHNNDRDKQDRKEGYRKAALRVTEGLSQPYDSVPTDSEKHAMRRMLGEKEDE
jgi:hypothetical protein